MRNKVTRRAVACVRWLCGAALLSLASLVVAQEGTREAEPIDRAGWFTGGDYPIAAKRRGESGTVHFVLDVSADGSVSGCSVKQSSGSETLDDATCALASARGRFEPARNAQGEAVAAQWTGEVTWGGPPAKEQAWRISWADPKNLGQCTTVAEGRSQRLEASFCQRLAKSVKDHGGTPGQPLTVRGPHPPLAAGK